MNTLKLLPRWCRFLGLAVVIPILLMCFYNPDVIFGDISFYSANYQLIEYNVLGIFDNSFQHNENDELQIFIWKNNDLSNEILLALMLIGTYLIAFAKVKSEDEFSSQLRLQSLTSAVIWNSVVLFILNFLVYDGMFLYVMASQLVSFLLIFSVIFAFKIRKFKKGLTHEK